MGVNCPHALCNTCVRTLLPADDARANGVVNEVTATVDVQNLCPVCDSPIEKIDCPDHTATYFDVLKSAKEVVSCFDRFLTMYVSRRSFCRINLCPVQKSLLVTK